MEGTRIYFNSNVYGKATKCRQEEPSMFQLLQWQVQGFEGHCFKKCQKFHQANQAYCNMIAKKPWQSQFQENFIDHRLDYVEANATAMSQIQQYIEERIPGDVKRGFKKGKMCNSSVNLRNKVHSPNKTETREKSRKNTVECKRYEEEGKKSVQEVKSEERGKVINSKKTLNENKELKTVQTIKQKSQSVLSPKGGNKKQLEQKLYQKTQETKCISSQQKQKLIQEFKQTTRWIPNSAFTTYFGKPPFENYGRGNTRPVDGGIVYGTYLYSHSVHPHRGANVPSTLQSYPVALKKAKSHGVLYPTQPRTSLVEISNTATGGGRIDAEKNSFGRLEIGKPDLNDVKKFGGKKTK